MNCMWLNHLFALYTIFCLNYCICKEVGLDLYGDCKAVARGGATGACAPPF